MIPIALGCESFRRFGHANLLKISHTGEHTSLRVEKINLFKECPDCLEKFKKQETKDSELKQLKNEVQLLRSANQKLGTE